MAKPSRFAHLFRVPVRASEDDENNTDDHNANSAESEGGEDEGEDDKPKNRKARRADKSKKAKKAKKAGRADDDGDEDSDGQDDEVAEEEGDDASDEEDEDDGDKASARARERGRGAAIFSAPGAAANPALAAQLAFTTNLPRSKAISILNGSMASGGRVPAKASPAEAEFEEENQPSAISALDQRMSRSRRPPVPAQEERQGSPDPSSPRSVAARMVERARAFRK
ncbi:hypothetical protein [Gluconobacter cadivus]|uniref:hypothetical protein n=1 Tax=Gluconobacter cadivus TaxID=2728101 RepID=UPI001F3B45E0|nr:hypothetical protein [Gluconobacter cadivus]